MSLRSAFERNSEDRVNVESICLSGASGFIGRRLAPKLLDSFPTARIECLTGLGDSDFERAGKDVLRVSGIPFRETDLVTGKGLEGLVQSPAILFHLAASTSTWHPDHRCNDV